MEMSGRITTAGYPVIGYDERIRLRHLRSEYQRSTVPKEQFRLALGRTVGATDDQVRAAYARYLEGESIRSLADDLWRVFEYASRRSCQQSLTLRFRRLAETT